MKKIKKDILRKIKDEEIKIKPGWEFKLVNNLIKGLFGGMIIGLALASIIIGLFLDQYKLQELWEYGDIGRDLLIADFPYIWLITALLAITLAWVGYGKIGTNYRTESIKKILLTIVWILLTVVVAIAYLYLF